MQYKYITAYNSCFSIVKRQDDKLGSFKPSY